MGQDRVELVGEYDPEVEELLKQAKREKTYFDDQDPSSKTHLEEISEMEKDPVIWLLIE